jgi:hypothetical protein
MTKAARAPLRLHLAIIIPVIVACIALIIWKISFVIPLLVAGQAYLLIIVLLAFRYWPPMIRLVKRMPIPHRMVFGLLIGGMIIGHFTLSSRKYFPFVAWEIFPVVREEDPVTCREIIATTASGKNVRLLVEQLIPSIVQFNLPADPVATKRLIVALAKIYNEKHADDPVRHVDLMLMAVKLHPSPNESRFQPSCELLKRYDISSGR